MSALSYDTLHEAVAGTGVGLRSRPRFEPLGGSGDKVFPPTYGVADSATTRYASEKRRVGAASVDAVVLDSVAAQANRFELALLEAYRAGELRLPVVSVDFAGTDAAHLDRLSALEAPHRVFDALLRDSLLDGVPFRHSDPGRAITEATHRNAAALFHHSPTTLLFGGWDSTGPKGGKGAKYERALTSEIVALGVETGVRTSSRIDPAGIERGVTLYEDASGDWTLDEGRAVTDKGGSKRFRRSGEGEAGRPSHANHGNVTPSIDPRAGGVTADEIVGTTVISFPALRRLRFPVDTSGRPVPAERRRRAEAAAHTALAALGLAAAALAFEQGFDLRSRCVLVPSGPLEVELLGRGGPAQPEPVALESGPALTVLDAAVEAAAAEGLTWMADELVLRPSDRLVSLINQSVVVAASTGESD